jgi:hypothetical protein|tara:strand:+ start:396 stop:617 length:222 start_codon:yes stop_codon:yes gene_type:complete
MEDFKPRLDRLEWRVDSHSEQLTRLNEQTADLKLELNNINKSLMQIKWIAVGAALVIAGQSMGLGNLFKLLGV